jgi:hypothetical protein
MPRLLARPSLGGAVPKKITDEKSSDNKSTECPTPKPTKTLSVVASVTNVSDGSSLSNYVMHQEPLVGAINLTKEQGRKLWSMFKCPQCRWNWTITKKQPAPKSDGSTDTAPSSMAGSVILSPSGSISEAITGTPTSGLALIPEELDSDVVVSLTFIMT